MNIIKNLAIVSIVVLIISIVSIIYSFYSNHFQYTEGGMIAICFVSIIVLLLNIFFIYFLYALLPNIVLKESKLLIENDLIDVQQEKENTNSAITEMTKSIEDIEQRTNDNFHVLDQSINRLIHSLRNNLPINREFETNYVLSIAKYKLKSKSLIDKEQAILTIHASGGRNEMNLLVDIIDNKDEDERIKIVARAALRDIINRINV